MTKFMFTFFALVFILFAIIFGIYWTTETPEQTISLSTVSVTPPIFLPEPAEKTPETEGDYEIEYYEYSGNYLVKYKGSYLYQWYGTGVIDAVYSSSSAEKLTSRSQALKFINIHKEQKGKVTPKVERVK